MLPGRAGADRGPPSHTDSHSALHPERLPGLHPEAKADAVRPQAALPEHHGLQDLLSNPVTKTVKGRGDGPSAGREEVHVVIGREELLMPFLETIYSTNRRKEVSKGMLCVAQITYQLPFFFFKY